MFVLSQTQFNSSPVVGFQVLLKHGSLEYSFQPQKSPFSIHMLSELAYAMQRKTAYVQLPVQIAKFKFRQYQNSSISPNLPAKFAHYTV